MAFRELAEGLQLPDGASERYRKLEALGRMLTGELYEDLQFPFETEKNPRGEHIEVRKRRPSVDFNLAYQITQDTLAELFGDEQFPAIQVLIKGEHSDDATAEMAEICDAFALQDLVTTVYEEGVVGSVGVVVHRQPNGTPFYGVIPGKYCEPIYRSTYSDELMGLMVTYPIEGDQVAKDFPELYKKDEADTYWYRYLVGPNSIVDYYPLSDHDFAHLGEKRANGDIIEFKVFKDVNHGWMGRTPALFVKNLQRINRSMDGPALWWPIRNICIEIDYTLSQAGRGLRYAADPMLFMKRGDNDFDQDDVTEAGPGGGMSANNVGGAMVRGVTGALVGGPDSDAKLLEIGAAGITEERLFVQDLREYALEVVGGMKARAVDHKGMDSGKAIDKGLKPLRRLVRRQRRPYGNGFTVDIIDLTMYGYRIGVLDKSMVDADFSKIPEGSRTVLDWPNDETLQGQDFYYHVEAAQLAAGGSATAPLQLVDPAAMGKKLVGDMGLHEPYSSVAGDCEMHAAPQPESTGGDTGKT